MVVNQYFQKLLSSVIAAGKNGYFLGAVMPKNCFTSIDSNSPKIAGLQLRPFNFSNRDFGFHPYYPHKQQYNIFDDVVAWVITYLFFLCKIYKIPIRVRKNITPLAFIKEIITNP